MIRCGWRASPTWVWAASRAARVGMPEAFPAAAAECQVGFQAASQAGTPTGLLAEPRAAAAAFQGGSQACLEVAPAITAVVSLGFLEAKAAIPAVVSPAFLDVIAAIPAVVSLGFRAETPWLA